MESLPGRLKQFFLTCSESAKAIIVSAKATVVDVFWAELSTQASVLVNNSILTMPRSADKNLQ